jgi:hypothetical protein
MNATAKEKSPSRLVPGGLFGDNRMLVACAMLSSVSSHLDASRTPDAAPLPLRHTTEGHERERARRALTRSGQFTNCQPREIRQQSQE